MANITGTAGNDTITPGSVSAGVTGGPVTTGNDSISGLEGNDSLSGGFGNDTIDGGDGNDTITDFDGENLIFGGPGNDSIQGWRGSVLGGAGDDTIIGGATTTHLYGEDGNDVLISGYPGGELVGGDGDDIVFFSTAFFFSFSPTIQGGGGQDIFVARRIDASSALVTTIENFDAGIAGDLLSLSSVIANLSGYSGQNPFGTAGYMRLRQVGVDVFVDVDQNGGANSWTPIIRLTDTNIANLTFENFGWALDGSEGGSQIITGTTASDTLTGSATNDTIYGFGYSTFGSGDTIRGGLGGDLIIGGQAADSLFGEDGDDSINASAGNDTVLGGAGNDTLIGGSGFDSLDGGAGSDSIDGGDGSDTLLGGDNDDTLIGASGNDTLDGGNGDDVLLGGDNNDTLNGGAGDDSLNGGTGDDFFLGSAGFDTIVGGGGSDFLSYAPLGSPVSVTYGASGYGGTVTKAGGETDIFSGVRGVIGTGFNDTLVGSDDMTGGLPYGVVLEGRAGNDIIDGRKSTLNLASYFNAPTGIVAMLQQSTDGSGNWFGSVSDGYGTTDALTNVPRIQGSAFSDTITGSARNDFFDGTRGSDVYDGGTDFNIVDYGFAGGIGAVTITLGAVGPGLFGWGSATVAKSLGGTDTLTNVNEYRGTGGADSIIGTTSAYSWNALNIRGGAGNDTLDGQSNAANRMDYSAAGSAANINLTIGTAFDGQGGTDLLINVRAVRSSNFNDTIFGSAFNDNITLSAGGNQTIDGAGGINQIFSNSTSNTVIDLGDSIVAPGGFGGWQGTITRAGGVATIYNFSGAAAGNGNDTLYGTPGDDFLGGSGGNNLIDGRGGFNWLNYRAWQGNQPFQGAIVDLTAATATNPWGGTDTLVNIQNAIGSQFGDTLIGLALPGQRSFLRGDGGDDTLIAPGAGTLVTARYTGSLTAVTVDLAAGQTLDDGWFGGVDTLIDIRSVMGSNFGDSLDGAAADDWLDGVGGDDTARGLDGNDTLDGGDGNDSLNGGKGIDSLAGGAGNDSLDGGKGADTLVGGTGDDRYIVDNAADTITEAAGEGSDTVDAGVNWTLGDNLEVLVLTGRAKNGTGNALDNHILGNAGKNNLAGGAGNDTLDGGDGSDTLDGGTGADSMIGGTGNDVYLVDDPGDVILELALGGTDEVRAGIDYVLGAELEKLTLTGAALNGTGNGLNNVIRGNGNPNLLSGLGGKDELIGGGGADSLDGGAQGDLFRWLQPNHGNDTVAGFNPAQDDLAFSAAGFGGGLVAGVALTAAQFEANATGTASTADVRFIVNTATGVLTHDVNGNGAGGASVIATFLGLPALSVADFVIIA